MKKNKNSILIAGSLLLVLCLALIIGASMQPQLSQDEQSVIVDAVIQTLNPQAMSESIAATVRADVLYYLGIAPPTAVPSSGYRPMPKPRSINVLNSVPLMLPVTLSWPIQQS